jgi:hypothetical protein
VDGVDLAEVVGQPLGEHAAGQAAQEAFAVQRPEDLRRRGLDVLREAEPAALGDGEGSQLPGPVVDVSEDPAVDRAQVPQVVAGRDW